MGPKYLTALLCAAPLICLGQGTSTSFNNPASFSSNNHLLDLLLIARPETVHLGSFSPTAWIYEACQTSVAVEDQCPADSRTAASYAGVVLHLQPGDHLRIKLVNHLPPAPSDDENAHGSDPMMNEMLMANPTNIHTHGLIVEPRKADASDPTYGDYVYVVGYPAGKLPPMVDPDLTATDQPIQYDIYIPTNHPSGLYYFHPHIHGLGVNQISEGLEGMLTVGSIQDEASATYNFTLPPNFAVRYMDIRDMQVLPNGEIQDQEEPDFCSPLSDPDDAREGSCAGANPPPDAPGPGPMYEGGKWFFTINGAVYPTINVDQQNGEVWRLLNGAASRIYDLTIKNDQNHAPVVFQVLSLDGVALAPTAGTDVSKMTVGGRFKPVQCPGPKQPHRLSEPVCATHMVMFPSSRADIFLGSFEPGHLTNATFLTTDISTGPAGDDWPAANLAHLVFSGKSAKTQGALNVKPLAATALSAKGALGGPVKAMYPGMTQPLPIADAKQIAAGKSVRVAGRAGCRYEPAGAIAFRVSGAEVWSATRSTIKISGINLPRRTARLFPLVTVVACSSEFHRPIPTVLGSAMKKSMRRVIPSRAPLRTSLHSTPHSSTFAFHSRPATRPPQRNGNSSTWQAKRTTSTCTRPSSRCCRKARRWATGEP